MRLKNFFFNKLDGWTFVNPSCSLSFNIVLYLTIFWNQWIIDLSICLHQQPSPTKFFLKKKILFKNNMFVILFKMWKHTANTWHLEVILQICIQTSKNSVLLNHSPSQAPASMKNPLVLFLKYSTTMSTWPIWNTCYRSMINLVFYFPVHLKVVQLNCTEHLWI